MRQGHDSLLQSRTGVRPWKSSDGAKVGGGGGGVGGVGWGWGQNLGQALTAEVCVVIHF